MISIPGLSLKLDAAGTATTAQGETGGDFLVALLQAKGIEPGELNGEQLVELLQESQNLPLETVLPSPTEAVPTDPLALPLALDGGLPSAPALPQADSVGAQSSTPTQSSQALLALMLGAQQTAGSEAASDAAAPLDEAVPAERAAGERAAGSPLLELAGANRPAGLEGLQASTAQPNLADGEGFQALLQASGAARANPSSTPTAPLSQSVSVPVGEPGWGQAIGERLVWTVGQKVQHAIIRLDPPHLGALEITVSIKDDQASVTIQSQHALSREALEAEMPRLRAMLGESGFNSVDVNVAREQAGRQGEEGAAGGAGGSEPAAGERAEGESEVEVVIAPVSSGHGLVDHYA